MKIIAIWSDDYLTQLDKAREIRHAVAIFIADDRYGNNTTYYVIP